MAFCIIYYVASFWFFSFLFNTSFFIETFIIIYQYLFCYLVLKLTYDEFCIFFAIYHGSEKNAWILQVNYCETKYFANIFIAILPVKKQNTILKTRGITQENKFGSFWSFFAIFCRDLFSSPALLAREIFTGFHFGYSRPFVYRKQVRRQVDFTGTIKCGVKIELALCRTENSFSKSRWCLNCKS